MLLPLHDVELRIKAMVTSVDLSSLPLSHPPGSRTPATRQPFPQKQTIRAKKAIVEQNPGRTCSIELDDDQRDQRSVFVR